MPGVGSFSMLNSREISEFRMKPKESNGQNVRFFDKNKYKFIMKRFLKNYFMKITKPKSPWISNWVLRISK